MALPVVRVGDAPAIQAFLAERLHEFNAKATGYFDGESFTAVEQDDSGAIQAGIAGYTWGGLCFVSELWVAESRRGQGLGSALLGAAEAHARNRGCALLMLSSHSFQSPGFYERLGFERQAVVQDYPPGHSNVFLAKRLGG